MYVAYDMGAEVRPERDVVGVPQFEANEDVIGLAVPVQVVPPKLVGGEVMKPSHLARVTSVHEEEPAVEPVPAAQATQALESIAEAPPNEYKLLPQAVTPAPTPEAPAPQ